MRTRSGLGNGSRNKKLEPRCAIDHTPEVMPAAEPVTIARVQALIWVMLAKYIECRGLDNYTKGII